jgi:hypothetical protein
VAPKVKSSCRTRVSLSTTAVSTVSTHAPVVGTRALTAEACESSARNLRRTRGPA